MCYNKNMAEININNSFITKSDVFILNFLSEYYFIDSKFKSRSDIKRLIQQGGIQYFHNGIRDTGKWQKFNNINQTFYFYNNTDPYIWIKTGKISGYDLIILSDKTSIIQIGE